MAAAALALVVVAGAASTARAVGCSGDCCQKPDGCTNVTPCNSTNCTIPGSGNSCLTGKHCTSSGLCSAAVAEGLESFSAVRSSEGVRVQWTIASDLSASSFNVHRAPESFKPFEVVNPAPIQTESGQTEYEYLDTTATEGATFFYIIEAIPAEGDATLHGLIEVKGDGTVSAAPLDKSVATPAPGE